MSTGVTTLYFETEKEDDLRKVGYSKERRIDPQIIVGLLVDRAGFPLRISCWEGNRAETTTIVSVVEQFRQAAKVEPLVIVAGRRHAVNRQPERPKRGRSRLHRRLTHHPRSGGPGGTLPLARGRLH